MIPINFIAGAKYMACHFLEDLTDTFAMRGYISVGKPKQHLGFKIVHMFLLCLIVAFDGSHCF